MSDRLLRKRVCECRSGSDPCPHCGESVFHVDCHVWHAMRVVVEAAEAFRDARYAMPKRHSNVYKARIALRRAVDAYREATRGV